MINHALIMTFGYCTGASEPSGNADVPFTVPNNAVEPTVNSVAFLGGVGSRPAHRGRWALETRDTV